MEGYQKFVALRIIFKVYIHKIKDYVILSRFNFLEFFLQKEG